jgi:hypothetical protein
MFHLERWKRQRLAFVNTAPATKRPSLANPKSNTFLSCILLPLPGREDYNRRFIPPDYPDYRLSVRSIAKE